MKNFTKSLLFCLSVFFVTETRAQFGNALSYDPANSQFTTMPSGIVSSISPNGTSFTIEAWVYWKGGGNYQRIFDFGFGDASFGDNTIGYMYMTPSNGAGVAFGFKIPNFPERQVSSGSPLPINAWSHVAIVVDYGYNDGFGTPTGFLYVNGNRVGFSGLYNYDGGPPVVVTSYYPSALANASETNWLGHPRSLFDPYFNGIIDELRISNNIRYSGATYTVPTAPFTTDANTLALYHFNEGTGQTSVDATSNNAAAILGPTGAVEAADPSWSLSILPVKINQFAAQKSGNAINLKWRASTIDEQGRFVIERSADGSHFSAIGTVDISKTGGTFDYSFTDRTINSNKNYYRLKIEENNSAPKYSSIVFVNMQVDYAIYPTLAKDHIYIAVPKQTNMAIYNSAGILMKKARLISSQDVDVTTLSSGVYYVKFEDSKQIIPFSKL